MAGFGQSPMPWQAQVAEVGGELVFDEELELWVPAYRSVIVTVERQAGKTTIVLGWQVQRAHGWGSPQRMVYSAQTGNDARKKLVEDWEPALKPYFAKLGIKRILKGAGSEAIDFFNGSRTVLMGSGDDAGHGKTVDLGVKDEFFADTDDRRDQALVPAMATRPQAQVLTLSTMGTADSVPLHHAVDLGRAAVESGQRRGIAYFEWSFPDDADIDDPLVWWANHPALGYTITEDVLADARATLTEGEFRRAFGNQRTASENRIIPVGVWDAVCSPTASPGGTVRFGVDVNEGRTAAAIVAVGGGAIEVVAHRPGTAWLADAVASLAGGRPLVAIDGGVNAPVASMVPELTNAGARLLPITDLAAASSGFYDAIVDRKVEVRRHPSMDAAVAGAAKRIAGDGWAFARKSSADDIAPLMAATVAWWAEARGATPANPRPAIHGDVDKDAFDRALAQIEEDEARAYRDLDADEARQ